MPERIELVPPNPTTWYRWGFESSAAGGGIDWPKITEAYVREHFSSAGVLPIMPDASAVLLGAHQTEFGKLWGPFAGGREPGEQPEDTARREKLEELGGGDAKLHKPVIIIDATRTDKQSIGVIFPVIIPPDVIFTPNQEICEVRWFTDFLLWDLTSGDEGCAWQLWGGVKTWVLIREWEEAKQRAAKLNHPPKTDDILNILPIRAGAEIYPGAMSPYNEWKRKGKD